MQVPARLTRIAASQDGLISRAQALESGLTDETVRHALDGSGQWQRVHRGIYAVFSGQLQQRHVIRAALLVAGPNAMVTGSAACRAYGMTYVPRGPTVILVPNHVRKSPPRGITFQRVRSVPRPRMVRSFPCAPPERAALDACAKVDDSRAVRAAMCEVVQRGLTSPDQLVTAFRGTRYGNPAIRLALDDIRAGCRSAPECEAHELIGTSAILPEPIWNQPLPDVPDIVPDARWDAARLIVEIDSAEWHRFGDRPEQTERRRARLAALGWRVIPVSPRRLREEPDAVLAEIEKAYRAGIESIYRDRVNPPVP